MYSLVMKDFRLLKKTLLFVVIYTVAMTIMQPLPPAATASIVGWLLILNANVYDEKNKSDIFLNSLPVSRKQIVGAKYASFLAFGLLSVGASAIVSWAMQWLAAPDDFQVVQWQDFVIVSSSVMLAGSVFYPLYYKFGGQYVRIAMLGLMFLAMIFANMIQWLVTQRFADTVGDVLYLLQSTSLPVMMLYLAAFTCIVALLSWKLSTGIYQKKDF